MTYSLSRLPFHGLALLAVVGCGSGNDPIVPTERVPTTITITPDPVSLTFLNHSVQLTARVRDQKGNVMATGIDWTIADPSVASIDASGLITSLAVGQTTLTATGLGLTASAEVGVIQEVTSFTATQGNNQEAIRDSTLADAIIVRAVDQGGSGIPGLAVEFRPAADNGTVTVSSVDTDENGEASTEWTLGSAFGEQRLSVSVPGQSLTVNAIARAEFPTPDLAVLGPLLLSHIQPSTLQTVTATASITNLGDLATGATRVALNANDVEMGTLDLPSLDPNDTTEVQFDIDGLSAGSVTLDFIADADDAVVELFESNNEVSRTINVVEQAVVTVGVPLTNLSAAIEEELLFKVDVAGPETMTVSFSASNGDADLYVAEATRPASREDYIACVSLSPDSNESCQVPFAEGTYHILIHAYDQGSGFSGGTLTVTMGDALEPYNIELDFLTSASEAQTVAFENAAARWQEIIVADVGDLEYSVTNPLEGSDPGNFCGTEQGYTRTTPIDDVLILVVVDAIDGQGNVLGQAGPCFIRGITSHTSVGTMTFDVADLVEIEASGLLEDVILHEMGHVLGVGTLWDNYGWLQNPSIPGNPGADTHFDGPSAIAAFDNVGGGAYVGSKVPVANDSIRGRSDSHWREGVLESELMTPFIEGSGSNPLSEVTVMSMKDLGYGVNPKAFDNYAVPLATEQVSAPMMVPGPPGLIDLRGDIREGSIYVVDKVGRVREILR